MRGNETVQCVHRRPAAVEEEQLKEQTLKRIREVVSPSPEPILPPPPPTPEPATGGLVHILPAPNAAPLQGATLAPPEDSGFFGHLMQLHETSVVAAATAVGMPMSLTGTNGGPSASQQEQPRLEAPKASLSSDTLSADASCPSTPGNLSSTASTATLVGSVGSNESPKPSPSRKSAPVRLPTQDSVQSAHDETPPPDAPPQLRRQPRRLCNPWCRRLRRRRRRRRQCARVHRPVPRRPPTDVRPAARGLPPPMTSSQSAPNVMNYLRVRGAQGKRGSSDTESSSVSVTPRSSFQTESTILSTPRSSFQYPDSPQHSSKAGVVVTSSRASTRRSSTASAAAAFAVATAGSSNPPEPLVAAAAAAAGGGAVPPGSQPASRAGSRLPSAVGADLKIPGAAGGAAVGPGPAALRAKRESMISTAATMRVLNVLRHWVSKHSQDFENDPKLLQLTTEFLEELVHNSNLLPAEHKAAAQLLHMISKQDQDKTKVDLDILLAPHMTPSKETVESLSALEIAEGMTYLDHKIFIAIRSEEFLGQAWMKPEKATKAPHILLMTRRFNDVSRLVVSEIMRCPEMSKRVTIIDKWSAVADICRCLHNFNGVLQICAAFMNSSVFRLKKTWEKVSKTTKQTIDKLQALVSADGRFRNMRDALHRCDPPCIPYLGMYLTDLSFIEEGTPNFTEEGLLNFSKMRMIAHVIREIRHFQQTPYKIEMIPKVFNYLLDPARLMPDEELYRLSLCLEPRLSRLGTKVTASPFTPSYAPTTTQQSSSTSETTHRVLSVEPSRLCAPPESAPVKFHVPPSRSKPDTALSPERDAIQEVQSPTRSTVTSLDARVQNRWACQNGWCCVTSRLRHLYTVDEFQSLSPTTDAQRRGRPRSRGCSGSRSGSRRHGASRIRLALQVDRTGPGKVPLFSLAPPQGRGLVSSGPTRSRSRTPTTSNSKKPTLSWADKARGGREPPSGDKSNRGSLYASKLDEMRRATKQPRKENVQLKQEMNRLAVEMAEIRKLTSSAPSAQPTSGPVAVDTSEALHRSSRTKRRTVQKTQVKAVNLLLELKDSFVNMQATLANSRSRGAP
ncbi:hypothetical protein MRX96_046472 [Rhipicephalus microplus]